MKRCKKCGESKEIAEYYKMPTGRDGHTAKCRTCLAAESREYQRLHAEAIKAARKTGAAHEKRLETWKRYRRSKGKEPRKMGDPVLSYRKSLLKTYGITLEQYDEMFKAQGGCCAICGRPESHFKRRLHVDHDHGTGKVRGLLCHHCNSGIGLMGDDVERLSNAIVYLTNASGKPVNVSVHAEKVEAESE